MRPKNFTGLDDFRAWLESVGFRVYRDGMNSTANLCDWYACRPASGGAECECNTGKAVQIVVHPHLMIVDGLTKMESAEVDITGEAGGEWYRLAAYSIRPADLRDKLPTIEASLIAAWNSLYREVVA